MWIRLLTFCLLLSVDALAQRVIMTEDLGVLGIDYYGIIGEVEGHILYYQVDGQDVEMTSFDQSMHKEWSRDLSLVGKRPAITGAIRSAEGFDIIYTHAREDDRVLLVDRYDAIGQRIDSIPLIRGIKKEDKAIWQYVISENQERVLLYDIVSHDELSMCVYDRTIDTAQWVLTLSYEDLKLDIELEEILVTDFGEAILIFDADNRRHALDRHRLVIQTIRSDGQLSDLREITIDSLVTGDASYAWDNIQRRLTGIVQAHPKHHDQMSGLLWMRINPYSGERDILRHIPIDSSILSAYYRDSDTRNESLENMRLRPLVLRRDGGAVVYLENVRELYRTNYSYASGSYLGRGNNIDYHYNDIIALGLNPDGGIHWQHVLRKEQYSYGDEGAYSSFFIMSTPSRSRLLFNDEIKKENTVSEYVLNGVGALRRFSVMNTQYQSLGLRFSEAVQISPLSIIVPSEVGNDVRLVKFQFN